MGTLGPLGRTMGDGEALLRQHSSQAPSFGGFVLFVSWRVHCNFKADRFFHSLFFYSHF